MLTQQVGRAKTTERYIPLRVVQDSGIVQLFQSSLGTTAARCWRTRAFGEVFAHASSIAQRAQHSGPHVHHSGPHVHHSGPHVHHSAARSAPSLCEREPALLDARHGVSSKLVRLAGELDVGAWRYFTAYECGSATESTICLSFRNRPNSEDWVATLESRDDGRSFGSAGSAPKLMLPAHWAPEPGRAIDWMTHNVAILRDAGGYTLFGGLSHVYDTSPGVLVAHGKSHLFGTTGTTHLLDVAGNSTFANRAGRYVSEPSQWRGVRTIFDGRHPGCVEGRQGITKLAKRDDGRLACEFDGRLSAVRHRGRTWLYARANPGLSGQRYVQATSSSDLVHWAPFKLLEIDKYHLVDGDIYFLAAQVNPLAPDSLVGIAPVVHLQRGCIGLTVSRDGLRKPIAIEPDDSNKTQAGKPSPCFFPPGWSKIVPLMRCDRDLGDPISPGHRTVHQPAAGMLRRGSHVLIFVHEHVAGILQREPGHKQKSSKLRRWAVPVTAFANWTQAALCSLDGGPMCEARTSGIAV